MTPAEHIHNSLDAALLDHLAGQPLRAASLVLVAAVPVFRGLIDWQGVQDVAKAWLARVDQIVVGSPHASQALKADPRRNV